MSLFAVVAVKQPEVLFKITTVNLETMEPYPGPPNLDYYSYLLSQLQLSPQQVGQVACQNVLAGLCECVRLCARSFSYLLTSRLGTQH